MRGRIAFAGLLLPLLAVSAGAQQPVQPLDGEAIAAIWKERQDKVKTATFETTRTTFRARGALTTTVPLAFVDLRLMSNTGEQKKHVEGPVPQADYNATAPERFLLDGEKIRYDYSSVQVDWARSGTALYLLPQRTAFDGKHYREINSRKDNEDGVLSKHSDYPDANLAGMGALLTTLRGRTKKLTSINPHDLTATGRRATINGYECLEYQLPKLGEKVCTAWLSPAQGWNIIRIVEASSESNTTVNRRYTTEPTAGWVPVSWERTYTRNGAILTSDRFDVTAFTINTSIEPDTFTLKFTPGTQVFHEDMPGGVVGKVQEDGSIIPDDGCPAYYLPGMKESSSRMWGRYALYALIALLVVVVVWRSVRRYRRATISPPPTRPSGEGVPS